MKQERRQNGRCNRVARLEKPDGLLEARGFSHGFFTITAFNIMKLMIFLEVKNNSENKKNTTKESVTTPKSMAIN